MGCGGDSYMAEQGKARACGPTGEAPTTVLFSGCDVLLKLPPKHLHTSLTAAASFGQSMWPVTEENLFFFQMNFLFQ